MDKLYAPWRSEYAKQLKKAKEAHDNTCVFCTQIAAQEDEKYLILARHQYHVIMLNKYPYNAGHLLIIPYEHIQNLDQQTENSRAELIELVNLATSVWQTKLKAPGINIGINLGSASGAGIPTHLHTHVLPRWANDTNFLPTLANTKQISLDLNEVYKDLRPYFKN